MNFKFTDIVGNTQTVTKWDFIIDNKSDLPRVEIHLPEENQIITTDFIISGVVFDDDGVIDFIIEYQGKQHYEPSAKFGGKKGFYQQQYNDNQKRRFCALHDFRLIEIPYTDENLISYDYIMKLAGY